MGRDWYSILKNFEVVLEKEGGFVPGGKEFDDDNEAPGEKLLGVMRRDRNASIPFVFKSALETQSTTRHHYYRYVTQTLINANHSFYSLPHKSQTTMKTMTRVTPLQLP